MGEAKRKEKKMAEMKRERLIGEELTKMDWQEKEAKAIKKKSDALRDLIDGWVEDCRNDGYEPTFFLSCTIMSDKAIYFHMDSNAQPEMLEICHLKKMKEMMEKYCSDIVGKEKFN